MDRNLASENGSSNTEASKASWIRQTLFCGMTDWDKFDDMAEHHVKLWGKNCHQENDKNKAGAIRRLGIFYRKVIGGISYRQQAIKMGRAPHTFVVLGNKGKRLHRLLCQRYSIAHLAIIEPPTEN